MYEFAVFLIDIKSHVSTLSLEQQNTYNTWAKTNIEPIFDSNGYIIKTNIPANITTSTLPDWITTNVNKMFNDLRYLANVSYDSRTVTPFAKSSKAIHDLYKYTSVVSQTDKGALSDITKIDTPSSILNLTSYDIINYATKFNTSVQSSSVSPTVKSDIIILTNNIKKSVNNSRLLLYIGIGIGIVILIGIIILSLYA
jgi:hypothetical protein